MKVESYARQKKQRQSKMNDSLSGKLVLQSFYNNQFQNCEDIEFICKIMSSVHDEKYKYINIYFRFFFFFNFFFYAT